MLWSTSRLCVLKLSVVLWKYCQISCFCHILRGGTFATFKSRVQVLPSTHVDIHPLCKLEMNCALLSHVACTTFLPLLNTFIHLFIYFLFYLGSFAQCVLVAFIFNSFQNPSLKRSTYTASLLHSSGKGVGG